jgi:class 3 adenylate cyclase
LTKTHTFVDSLYSDEATIVFVDQASESQLNLVFETDLRRFVPVLLDRLAKAGAVGVIFDFVFDRSWLVLAEGFLRMLLAMVGAILFCLASTLKFRRASWLAPLFAVAWVATALSLFFTLNILLPMVPVLAAVAATIARLAGSERLSLRANLHEVIGFDPSILESFRANLSKSGDVSVTKKACILCSDIRGYTSFVQTNDVSDVTAIMREYLSAMESIISDNGGYVNKYVGDEIVAVFGFPYDETRMCDRAVDAGKQMLSCVASLVTGWHATNTPHFNRIGIGVDCGDVTFLEVGSAKRQFDIIGNAMNGSARLQELTKTADPPFYISQESLGDLEQARLPGYRAETGTIQDPMHDIWPSHPEFEIAGSYPIRGQGERLVYKLIAYREKLE